MNRLRAWYFASAPAERLAALRWIMGLYALGYVIGRFGHLVGVARFSAAQFEPVGPVSILSEPLPYAMVVAIAVACVAFGAAFAIGWRFRVTGPAFAATLLWVLTYRNAWGMVFHTENLMVMHVLVLAGSPAADAWSLDARGREAPASARYGWAIRLLCIVTVIAYLIAGITKLRHSGFDWVVGDTLRNQIAYDNLRKLELGAGYSTVGGWLVGYGGLFPPLAAVSLAVELGAPLALLGPRIGRWWSFAAWSFHAGVLVLMFILFHYPLLGVAYAPFFAVERGVEWMRERVPDRWTPRWINRTS